MRAAERFAEHHFSANPEDHYRALYFQTLDDVIMGLTTRFEPTDSSIHLTEVEKFIIGECDVSYIKDFYKNDFEDYARLQLHRGIVADQAKSKNVKLENFESALQLMKDIPTLVPLVSEFAKLLRIILCMPVSTCTAERSFSGLRKLKSYLRSTMTQERLNHVAVISCHSDTVTKLAWT